MRDRFVPLLILATGWAIGLIVWFSVPAGEELPFELTGDAKLNVYRLEKIGGKSALIYEDLNQFLASLWHPPRLGLTIGVASSLLALAWYLWAPRARH